jgi:hypothetical protein
MALFSRKQSPYSFLRVQGYEHTKTGTTVVYGHLECSLEKAQIEVPTDNFWDVMNDLNDEGRLSREVCRMLDNDPKNPWYQAWMDAYG